MASDKLTQLLSDVFGIPPDQISEQSSPDTIGSWDSLTHINLIVALENSYGLSLDPEEALEMQSVKLIRLTLAEHGIDTSK